MLSTSFDRQRGSKRLTSSASRYHFKRDTRVASSAHLEASSISKSINKKTAESIVIIPNEEENLVTEPVESANRGEVNGPGGEENVLSSEENQSNKNPQINIQQNVERANNLA